MLKSKDIPVDERLIFALDVPDATTAMNLVDELGDSVKFYKLGLELFVTEGYHTLVKQLKDKGKRIFIDMKFFDVPRTVAAAVREMKGLDVDFVTVHGNEDILKEAVKEKGNNLKVLAVTVLTSIDDKDIADMFPSTVPVGDDIVKELVLSRAKRAMQVGCDGVISSGLEATSLRQECGESFIIVTPGIRPFTNSESDDQKRTVNIEQAFENGADYIVIGRPIRDHASPLSAAQEIQERIKKLFT